MQLRRLAVLAIIVALAACGSDDDGPGSATIDQMRVVKVSGDQAAQVPSAGGPSAAITLAAVVGTDGYTNEPLVARVVAEGEAGIMGIDAAMVPPGTLVHWNLPPEAGRLYGSTTATDDSAYVINRWAPGTKAGTYTATAGRLVGSEIVTDATWELVVLPGEPSQFDFPGTLRLLQGESREWSTTSVLDTYDNAVSYTLAADSVATVDGPRTLTGAAWGAGEYRVIVADTVAWTGQAYTFPDPTRLGAWVGELECVGPDTTYVDWMVIDSLKPLPNILYGMDARLYLWQAIDGERTVTANGDTVRQWIDDGHTVGALFPSVLPGRPVVLGGWAVRSYNPDPNVPTPLVRLSDTIPLADAGSLIWRLDDAVSTCHKIGYTSATAGTFTVRPLDS